MSTGKKKVHSLSKPTLHPFNVAFPTEKRDALTEASNNIVVFLLGYMIQIRPSSSPQGEDTYKGGGWV